jgi:hypothetical protein
VSAEEHWSVGSGLQQELAALLETRLAGHPALEG